MDNLESSPQLLIPQIPATECPKGTLTEIINYFFQTYLAQATINIPGLGDVTPEQIQQIQDELINLANKIDAIQSNVRSGTSPLTTGDTDVQITFSQAMPSPDYDIHVELIDAAGTGATATSWAVVGGTKTTTGMKIRFYDVHAAITSFNWSVRQIPT